jgi:hypothetical protein
MEHVSLFEAIAAEEMYPRDLWHYAPTTERERIQQHGLFPVAPENKLVGTPEAHPTGVYVFNNNYAENLAPGFPENRPKGFLDKRNFQNMLDKSRPMADLWKIPGGTIPASNVNPWAGTNDRFVNKATGDPLASFISEPVSSPELHTPYENRVNWPMTPQPVPDEGVIQTNSPRKPITVQVNPITEPTPAAEGAAGKIIPGLGVAMMGNDALNQLGVTQNTYGQPFPSLGPETPLTGGKWLMDNTMGVLGDKYIAPAYNAFDQAIKGPNGTNQLDPNKGVLEGGTLAKVVEINRATIPDEHLGL